MKVLYITGGSHKSDARHKEEWQYSKEAIVVRVPLDTREPLVCHRYVSPSDVVQQEDPSFIFKSSTVRDGKLFACTRTEILIYELGSFRQLAYITHPYFNDVHHVCPTSWGTLAIANTGLDMAIEMSLDGTILSTWSALEESPWVRFSQDVDYRRVATTKPHRAHPNHIFEHDGRLWMTRSQQGDLLCLQDRRTIPIGETRAHDGLRSGNLVYCTTVDGRIVKIDIETAQRLGSIDLYSWTPDKTHLLGWCRGIEFLSSDQVLVGFSRIRSTTIKNNLKWVAARVGLKNDSGPGPSRVALYDMKAETIQWSVNLESVGMNEVFSIHAVDEPAED